MFLIQNLYYPTTLHWCSNVTVSQVKQEIIEAGTGFMRVYQILIVTRPHRAMSNIRSSHLLSYGTYMVWLKATAASNVPHSYIIGLTSKLVDIPAGHQSGLQGWHRTTMDIASLGLRD